MPNVWLTANLPTHNACLLLSSSRCYNQFTYYRIRFYEGRYTMQSSENFRLVVRRGPQPNQVYDLNKDIITIGRDITNDITINDPEVSRHHLRFTRGAGGFTLEDLGSTNGTFVNGQRLTGAKPLNNGDMLGLGETVTLGYEMARGASPAGQGGAVVSTVPSPAQQPYSPYSPQAAQQPPPQAQPQSP